MSDEEQESFCYFGTPLDPYDEDTIPRKKPITVEEQIATDDQGRRRFHGAFTGGFSAGFFNTVGTLEGWLPGEFRSSRSEKAEGFRQAPSDFMDDEDVGEFGIAPSTIRPKDDYSLVTSGKRKKQAFSNDPIPGEPVLHTLLTAGNETIGYFLMRNINRHHKTTETTSDQRVYGCEMPSGEQTPKYKQYAISPIYETYLRTPKTNTHGLGYVPLAQMNPIKTNKVQKFVIKQANNTKISIAGQAFGVGAFEDEDEDIYGREDMTNYDFELTEVEKTPKTSGTLKSKLILSHFLLGKSNNYTVRISKPQITIPASFTGIYKQRRSRFEPLPDDTEKKPQSSQKIRNADVRAKYLDEVKCEDRFVRASKTENVHDILEKVDQTDTMHGTKDMRDAVKMKLFGSLTRTVTDWQPHSMVYRRFNVNEPNVRELVEKSKRPQRTKNLIFESAKFMNEMEELKMPTTPVADIPLPSLPPPLPPAPTSLGEETPINTEEKIDLFKSVFLSDSDESSDVEDNVRETSNFDDLKQQVLSDCLLPPIRTNKDGLLSNLDTLVQPEVKQSEPDLYGPKLPPPRPLKTAPTARNESIEGGDDEWVEKRHKHRKKKHHHKKHH